MRRRLGGAHERQFTALNFPAGIETIEEMEKAWAKIDFGGKQSAGEMMVVIKEFKEQAKYVFNFWAVFIYQRFDRWRY